MASDEPTLETSALGGEVGGEGSVAPPFAVDARRSYGARSTENAVIAADNLDAMKRLARAGFGGRFRCIYFDPPFNTRRRYTEYDDILEPATWRAMMLERLEAARPLLCETGAIVVEIDDTELGSLYAAMDDVFGRVQRVSTITVVRSAATGHKAQNRGPVNVTDYLLVYAKSRATWRANPMFRERQKYDEAYSTWLENPDEPPSAWRFVPLAAHIRASLGRAPSRVEVQSHALAHARHVVRFAQPRYEAVSHEMRELIDRSRGEPGRVFSFSRAPRRDVVLVRGNRVLFLAHKTVLREGKNVLVEPLTNVWDDVAFQGIAREGKARFVRNKKPEKLLARIVGMTTNPGDWVLDAYLGSGTTAAVALKMQRRWIGIERGSHLDTLCLPRLRRVVDGMDETGITRTSGWGGGGGFHVWT